MATYVPLVTPLGELPEFPEEEKIYDLKMEGGGVPPEANEVFVYVFVTTHGEGSFQRGYYEFLQTCWEDQNSSST